MLALHFSPVLLPHFLCSRCNALRIGFCLHSLLSLHTTHCMHPIFGHSDGSRVQDVGAWGFLCSNPRRWLQWTRCFRLSNCRAGRLQLSGIQPVCLMGPCELWAQCLGSCATVHSNSVPVAHVCGSNYFRCPPGSLLLAQKGVPALQTTPIYVIGHCAPAPSTFLTVLFGFVLWRLPASDGGCCGFGGH
jgi:hypothetical protein